MSLKILSINQLFQSESFVPITSVTKGTFGAAQKEQYKSPQWENTWNLLDLGLGLR